MTKRESDGRTFQGFANFSVILYERGEAPAPLPDAQSADQTLRTVADWKARLGSPLVFRPDLDFAAVIAPQVISEALLATVPADARLRFRWRFLPSDTWWERDP